MTRSLWSVPFVAAVVLALAGCETEPKSPEAKANLHDQVNAAMNQFKRADPGLEELLNKSAGHVIFPEIGKGGAIVGGAYGRGEVFEKGQLIGYADLTQGSVGLQLGGQKFSELIIFQTEGALDKLKRGEISLGGDATAVAATAGASSSVVFKNGVAVFTGGEAGLMAGLSVAGQKISYKPISQRTTEGQMNRTSETPK